MEIFINFSKLFLKMELNKFDKKLLFELDSNARTSYVQLAKKVGLSKDSVKYRIDNYLKIGLIDGFYPLIDSSKIGFYSFRVYFSFKNASVEDENQVIDYLLNKKNVFYLVSVDGWFDVGFGFFAKSIIEFKKFLAVFKEKHPFVEIIQESIFLNLYHFDRNYFIKNKRIQKPKGIIQEPNKELIDELDEKILDLLSKNARMQIIELSKNIGLTPKAIIYRITNLEKKQILLGYKPKINLEKIGYSMYKIDIFLNDTVNKEKIRKYISQLPNIIHSEEVFNGSDLEFDIECKEYNEFKEIINTIKTKHGKSIKKIKYFRTTKIHKTNYHPKK
jgi:DNA-binding Lrp family transcriptional regulator